MLFRSNFPNNGINMIGRAFFNQKNVTKNLGGVWGLNGPKIGKNMLRKNKGCFQFFCLINLYRECCNITDFNQVMLFQTIWYYKIEILTVIELPVRFSVKFP